LTFMLVMIKFALEALPFYLDRADSNQRLSRKRLHCMR
jgi:hypothetical protein